MIASQIIEGQTYNLCPHASYARHPMDFSGSKCIPVKVLAVGVKHANSSVKDGVLIQEKGKTQTRVVASRQIKMTQQEHNEFHLASQEENQRLKELYKEKDRERQFIIAKVKQQVQSAGLDPEMVTSVTNPLSRFDAHQIAQLLGIIQQENT